MYTDTPLGEFKWFIQAQTQPLVVPGTT